ncbi:MAG: magnesium-translocating P-type ATPase [Simkaniaceae bacterium]|nr:magnesium-translocating P-type ATPase [Simkaniaceae bacterium]
MEEEKGLSSDEAKKRLRVYGRNALKVKKNQKLLKLLFAQINTPIIYMLFFAAGMSLVLYEHIDALIIFGIIFVSIGLTFFQEKGALKIMDKLLKMVQVTSLTLRDGEKKEIHIEEVVPGDVVMLNAGDMIPGDCRLLKSKDLYVDESTFTGESFNAEKEIGNEIFMGTHVISGTATALVISTGRKTKFGKIAEQLSRRVLETEFERGVRRFGYFLAEVTLVLLVIIFACNVYLARPMVESLLFSLALAVGLTPQLLPAIISVNLAHGAQMMAKKRVVVKKLGSIENFGSMDVLCSDKTGTLTSGALTLQGCLDAEGKESDQVRLYAYLNAFHQSGYVNPLDKAILKEITDQVSDWEKVDEVPYDFIRKRITIFLKKGEEKLAITKGDFRKVLEECDLSDTRALQERFEQLSEEGFRVLGISSQEGGKKAVFLGYLLFIDPPKEGIVETVHRLKELGVSLKILTGDNRFAARHVGKLFDLSEKDILTGPEIEGMSDSVLSYQVDNKMIFAEIEPHQKELIILSLRQRGHVVGYLGDGINDVTALHVADVSMAVDTGADAAKGVADIVLLEKDLSVLEAGVRAGRMTFANTLKYVFMASSANFGNMFSMAGASLFLPFFPLLPKQVLLTNLMTDFPEMLIATDLVDEEMVKRPRRWDIGFISKFMLIFGLISSVFDYATFGVLLLLGASPEEFRTGWFVESVISATLIVLVIRTFKPCFKSRPSTPLLCGVGAVIGGVILLPMSPLAPYLGFIPLSPFLYLMVGGLVIGYAICVELAKKFVLKRLLR